MRVLAAPVGRGLAAALLPLALALPALAGTPAEGFDVAPLPWPLQTKIVTLSGGDLVTFDGLSVDRWSADGSFVANLATLPAFGFPSFVRANVGETLVLVGENSTGGVHAVPLAGGGAQFVATLDFNFDAVFEDATHAVVSAALGGFGGGNDLVRLDVTTGATTPLAHVAGPSGPVALDAQGNLLYATQSPAFPAPPGSTNVLFFPRALLDGSTVLDESDAIAIGQGFDGGSSLAADAQGGVYLAEVTFGGPTRVVRVAGTSSSSVELFDGGGDWLDQLEFVDPGGPALFLAFQPASGGTLRFTRSGLVSERLALTPARPAASLSGPGVAGPGPFSLDLAGGPPSGSFLLYYGPKALVHAPELVFHVPGITPLFVGLDPGTLQLLPALFPLGTDGGATLPFVNPGGLEGALAAQALVLHPLGHVVGTSTLTTN